MAMPGVEDEVRLRTGSRRSNILSSDMSSSALSTSSPQPASWRERSAWGFMASPLREEAKEGAVETDGSSRGCASSLSKSQSSSIPQRDPSSLRLPPGLGGYIGEKEKSEGALVYPGQGVAGERRIPSSCSTIIPGLPCSSSDTTTTPPTTSKALMQLERATTERMLGVYRHMLRGQNKVGSTREARTPENETMPSLDEHDGDGDAPGDTHTPACMKSLSQDAPLLTCTSSRPSASRSLPPSPSRLPPRPTPPLRATSRLRESNDATAESPGPSGDSGASTLREPSPLGVVVGAVEDVEAEVEGLRVTVSRLQGQMKRERVKHSLRVEQLEREHRALQDQVRAAQANHEQELQDTKNAHSQTVQHLEAQIESLKSCLEGQGSGTGRGREAAKQGSYQAMREVREEEGIAVEEISPPSSPTSPMSPQQLLSKIQELETLLGERTAEVDSLGRLLARERQSHVESLEALERECEAERAQVLEDVEEVLDSLSTMRHAAQRVEDLERELEQSAQREHQWRMEREAHHKAWAELHRTNQELLFSVSPMSSMSSVSPRSPMSPVHWDHVSPPLLASWITWFLSATELQELRAKVGALKRLNWALHRRVAALEVTAAVQLAALTADKLCLEQQLGAAHR